MGVKGSDNGLSSIVADIGATNIRIARLTGHSGLGAVTRYATADFPGFQAALAHFLKAKGGPRPVRVALAVAGPVTKDEVKLTNNQWQFSIQDLKRELKLEQLEVVNDLAAMALLLPHLQSEEKVLIGDSPGNLAIQAPMAVLCPGTGLGIAGLVPLNRGWRPIATEGGHTCLAPYTDREMAAWQVLHERYSRVSVERVLSGPGLVELYTALSSLEGRETGDVRPEQIVDQALAGKDALAVETLDIFCAWLGDVAGDVALMYVAQGGVYLAGDILRTIFEVLKRSQFRARFENKGRGRGVVAATPTYLVTCELPVLQGCAYLLAGSDEVLL